MIKKNNARTVQVFEVGPRDGLQNEKRILTTAQKLMLVRGLVDAGVREIEIGSFVRPDRVPQMADSAQMMRGLARRPPAADVHFWSLVPNLTGLERARQAGVTQICLFTAASDGFNRANIGMTVAESMKSYRALLAHPLAKGLRVRGYVSTAFGCPYDGRVSARQALKVIAELMDLGVEEVSIGDTIGVATPDQVDAVIKPARHIAGSQTRVAVHFHDTRGTALANALRSYEHGVRIFDASVGGLGGCPYAPGASGNLATEDLVYLLEGLGERTGIDLEALCRLSVKLAKVMKRPPPLISSKVTRAFIASGAVDFTETARLLRLKQKRKQKKKSKPQRSGRA